MNLLLLYLSKNVPSITTNTILLLLLSFFVELLCLIGTFYHISTLNPSIIRLRILFGDSFSFQLSLFFPFWSCPFGSLFSVHISKRVRITRNAYESLFNRFASISTALLLYRETKRWRISKGHYLSKTSLSTSSSLQVSSSLSYPHYRQLLLELKPSVPPYSLDLKDNIVETRTTEFQKKCLFCGDKIISSLGNQLYRLISHTKKSRCLLH